MRIDIILKPHRSGAEMARLGKLAEIDREIERFREFERAGLNEIALCLYDDPEASIRVIGERVVPAFT